MIIMSKLFEDLAFWSYLYNGAISLYGFLLFAWYWKKVGRASDVYKFFTILLLSIAIVYGGNVHIRIIRAADHHKAIQFSDSLLWYARTWLEGLVLTIITFRMTKRVITTCLYSRGHLEDRRSSDDEAK